MCLIRAVVVALAVVASSAAAPCYADCTKDTDCKGERICVRGACTGTEGQARPEGVPAEWRHGPYVSGGGIAYETARNSGRLPGGLTGLGYSLERGGFYAYADLLLSSGGRANRLDGGGLGAGWIFHPFGQDSSPAIGLAMEAGLWKMRTCAFSSLLDSAGVETCQPDPMLANPLVSEYHNYNIMLTPFLRFGNQFTFTAMPRLAIGTRTQGLGDFSDGQTSITYTPGLTVALGWRFGAK